MVVSEFWSPFSPLSFPVQLGNLMESLGTAAAAGLGMDVPPPGQHPKLIPASFGQQFLTPKRWRRGWKQKRGNIKQKGTSREMATTLILYSTFVSSLNVCVARLKHGKLKKSKWVELGSFNFKENLLQHALFMIFSHRQDGWGMFKLFLLTRPAALAHVFKTSHLGVCWTNDRGRIYNPIKAPRKG